MDYYFCDTENHTHQVCTDQENPRCNQCDAIMTYGRFTSEIISGTILKPGYHKALDGNIYNLEQRFVMSY